MLKTNLPFQMAFVALSDFAMIEKKSLLYCSISILGPISSFLLTYGNFLLQCSNCQSLRAELCIGFSKSYIFAAQLAKLF